MLAGMSASLCSHSPRQSFSDTADTALVVGSKEITENTYFKELIVELRKQKCIEETKVPQSVL